MGDGTRAYAQTLAGAAFAFLDPRSNRDVPVSELVVLPVSPVGDSEPPIETVFAVRNP